MHPSRERRQPLLPGSARSAGWPAARRGGEDQELPVVLWEKIWHRPAVCAHDGSEGLLQLQQSAEGGEGLDDICLGEVGGSRDGHGVQGAKEQLPSEAHARDLENLVLQAKEGRGELPATWHPLVQRTLSPPAPVQPGQSGDRRLVQESAGVRTQAQGQRGGREEYFLAGLHRTEWPKIPLGALLLQLCVRPLRQVHLRETRIIKFSNDEKIYFIKEKD